MYFLAAPLSIVNGILGCRNTTVGNHWRKASPFIVWSLERE